MIHLKVGEVMEKITKDMCVNVIKNRWKSAFMYIIILEILCAIKIYLDSNSIWWLVICVVIFGVLTVVVYYALRKRFNVTSKNAENFIVEDVFINVHEKNAIANRFNRLRYGEQYDYEIKFSRNGIYKIILFSKKEPEEIDADYSAVFFSNPGDKFYLLISKNPKFLVENSRKYMIINAFNAKYYKLVEEDFDYIEEKYYPKK